jgi:glycosyltransferase involved in cell wall biosynthesis
VITPVRNRERWIGKTIETVLNQKLKNFELIFVDNNSTDKTPQIIEKYQQKDKRIKLIKLKKTHPGAIAACLNIGLKTARGKYYAQLDSDDEYTPDTLLEMVDFMESNPNCALAISYYSLIDEKSKDVKEMGIVKHLEYNRNNILRCEGAGALRVWRIDVMKEFNFFNEKYGLYGEDYDLLLKVSEMYDVGRVHKVLYKYRRHEDVTDLTRPSEVKSTNKVEARLIAFERRKRINALLDKYNTLNISDVPEHELKKIYDLG